MRKCPCPVLIRPSRRSRFARILAAVDPDPLDVVRDGVNPKILELATSWPSWKPAQLHVVHAWQVPCEHPGEAGGSGCSKLQVKDFGRANPRGAPAAA